MVDREEIRRWVEGFDPGDDGRAAESRATVLALLHDGAAPGSRTRFDPGHVTASALVFTADGTAVLLVHHDRLGRWLQPGGHLEDGDATVVAAACREVREETGVVLVGSPAPVLVGVDVHAIPAARGEPVHRHHDLMFAFVLPGPRMAPCVGSHRAAWCPVDELTDWGADGPLLRAVARGRAALAHCFVRC